MPNAACMAMDASGMTPEAVHLAQVFLDSGGLVHTSYRVTRWPSGPWTIDDAVLGLPAMLKWTEAAAGEPPLARYR